MQKPSTINSINSNPFVKSVRKRCFLKISVLVKLLASWSIFFTIQPTPIQAQQVFLSGNKNTPAEKPTESIRKTKDFLLKGNARYNGHNLDQAMEFAIEARKYCDYFKSLNLAGVIQADLYNLSTSKSLLLKAKVLGEDKGNNLDTIYFNLAGVEMLKKDFTSILHWLSKINNAEPFTKFLYYRGVANYQTGNIQQAINDLIAAIELDPKNADIYYHLGLALYETGNYTDALPNFEMAVKLTPGATVYHIALANVLEKLNQNRKSLRHFTIANNQEPENLHALLGMANLHFKLGKFPSSLKLFQKALDEDRNSEDAYYGMGSVFYAQKRYVDAVQNYTRCIKLNPNFAPAYVGKANILCHLGEYGNAIADYSACIHLDPSNAQAYEGRAIAYFRAFNYYSAISDFDQCLILNKEYPFSYDAYISKGFADYNTGNYEDALLCFQQAIIMEPKKATGYDGLGCVYFALEKFELSVSIFNTAIVLAPDNDVLYTNRGNALYRIMAFDKAIEDYTKALEINPGNEHAFNGRGICLHQFEKYTKAISAFEKGIELSPFNYDLHRNLGISRGLYVKELRDSGKIDEANLQYELMLMDHTRSLEFSWDSSGYLINLGYLHMIFGEYDKAMDYLNKVTNPSVLMFAENNKGVVLAMRENGKNLFQAYEHFDKAVTTDIDQKYPNPRVNRALIGQELGRPITGDQQAADFISSNNFIKILHKDKYYSTYFYYALMRYSPPPTEHGFENEVITKMPEFTESNIDYLVYESDNECYAPLTPKYKTLNLRDPKKNRSNLAFCPRNF